MDGATGSLVVSHRLAISSKDLPGVILCGMVLCGVVVFCGVVDVVLCGVVGVVWCSWCVV